ncbi:MAG: hypothetical protein IRZ22_12305 [Alicyclobacillaceae bacterium]|nr:hypothetical protein [Alicyclobacillaceae bacterium]
MAGRAAVGAGDSAVTVVADISGWLALVRQEPLEAAARDVTGTANLLVEGFRYLRLDGVILGWVSGSRETWAECARRMVARLGRERVWGAVPGPLGRIATGVDPWDAEDAAGAEVEDWAKLGVGGVVVDEPSASPDILRRHEPLLRQATHYDLRVLLAVGTGPPPDPGPWWAVAVPGGQPPWWTLADRWDRYAGAGVVLRWPTAIPLEEAQRLAQRP